MTIRCPLIFKKIPRKKRGSGGFIHTQSIAIGIGVVIGFPENFDYDCDPDNDSDSDFGRGP
jgi:hypothetical protein